MFRRLGSVVLSYDYGDLGEARFRIDAGDPRYAQIRTPWPGVVLNAGMVGSRSTPISDDALRVFRRMAVAIAEGEIPLTVSPEPEMIASGSSYVRDSANGVVILHNPRGNEKDDPTQLAGYPVDARNAVEAALEAWRPYLTPTLRQASLDDIRARVELALADAARTSASWGFGR